MQKVLIMDVCRSFLVFEIVELLVLHKVQVTLKVMMQIDLINRNKLNEQVDKEVLLL